jgi:hypothetical protein
MSQPRGRGVGVGKRVGATRGETHEQSPAILPEGHWAGDVRAFVDWCEGTSDLDAYRAALATVPPHDTWKAVSRTLHAEIEFTPRPADTGPRARTVETFRTLDPDGAELREAKRRILEAEITRRAMA